MKIFNRNTADLLRERVEELEQLDHHGWRCIYMQLHDKEERFNAMLRANFINRAIVDLLARDEGYIYFCEDGDIVILFEGALKPVVAKLSGHFGDLNPEQLRGQTGDSLFSFFDLSKHWEGFAELCREKTEQVVAVHNRLPRVAINEPAHRLDRMGA